MISRFTKQLKGAAILGALLMGSNAFAQLGLKWGELGPNDIAGRCRSILIDNTDGSGNRLFAAGVSGGIFRSTDAGANWSAINDQAQSLIVSSMAQDGAGNIYFGTGETFGRGGDGAGLSGFIGTGLYRLAASSTSITALQDSSLFGNINEVAVAGTNTVYVAANKGFFISTDGGFSFNEETVSATGTLAAMDVKVAKNGDVYYAAGAKDYSLSAVYYASAGSSAFTSITPTVIANRGRIEIAPSPVDPNYVYLSIAKMKTAGTASTGVLSAIMVSDDKGVTWKTITIGSVQFDPFVEGTTGNGDYSNTIVADPIEKDICYVGGEVFYVWEQLPSNPLGQGTWTQIGINVFVNQFPLPQLYIHSKIHDVKFNLGNNSMYIATDGGIFKSAGGGFVPYNKGFNISQFNSVSAPLYPAANAGPTNTLAAVAGVAGGSIGNNLTYLPGYYLNGPMTSKTFGSTDAYQADFSVLNPKAIVYAGAYGSLFRTNDIDVAAPATFYDGSYRGSNSGVLPGSVGFANENTPGRLWEQYKNADTAMYLNEQSVATIPNIDNTKTKFAIFNVKGQRDHRYERVYITTASTKSISPPASQTITIIPQYNGPNTIVGHVVTGNANTSSVMNNRISLSTNTATPQDSIFFEFATAPKDSSVITVITDFSFQTNEGVSTYGLAYNTSATTSTYAIVSKIRPKKKYHYTNMVVAVVSTKMVGALPTQTLNIAVGSYTGNSIPVSSQTVTGAALGATIALNNTTVKDTLKLSFAGPTDSCRFDLYTDYITYDSIIVKNTDVSGYNFETGMPITSYLSTTVTPVPVTKLPLRHSARYAVGTIQTNASIGPSIFVTKKPLNFSLNPDYVRIVGRHSKMDGPGGVPGSVVAPVTGSVVTRLEWAHNGKCLYFSTKLNDTSYFFYRVSHLEFIGDSTDYGGAYASDIDLNSASVARPNVPQRTTPLGRFKYPITGIAISASDSMVAITCGGYKNKLGTVYYSNSNVTKMNMNNTNTANFDIKNGGTLPFTPAYTGIFEMSDDKTVLVGTESGVYSTTDITQASPNWTKEVGTTNNFPNVPVFQLRQQKEPSYRCYNSGVIYAATHGRGIWSTDKFFVPYAIGIQEQENTNYGFTSSIKLMPNPAGDAASIWFKASSDAAYRVTVYDINGRVMIQETTGKLMEGEQVLNLNTSRLTTGVYFVNVVGSNNFSATSKLVITH